MRVVAFSRGHVTCLVGAFCSCNFAVDGFGSSTFDDALPWACAAPAYTLTAMIAIAENATHPLRIEIISRIVVW